MKEPKAKKLQKVYKKTTKDDTSLPVEVIVYDCVQHEKAIVEYRNENKWWFGARIFKVYHPAFKETPNNSRWVSKLGRILGPFRPEIVPDTRAEHQVIRELLR